MKSSSHGLMLSPSYRQCSDKFSLSLSPYTHSHLFVKIEFSPSLKKLEKNVDMLPQLIGTISEFKRLPELISCKESQEKPIHISIGLCFQSTDASVSFKAVTIEESRNLHLLVGHLFSF